MPAVKAVSAPSNFLSGLFAVTETLNRQNFPGAQYPNRIMQFGEGNFLRAFVDWQIDLLNEHTDLNAGVCIIRPIDFDGIPLLDTQDGLYTTVIRGINEHGEAVETTRLIRSVNREIPVYKAFDEYMALAKDADIRFIFSNTTEAGIAYNPEDQLTDKPASSFPAKLTQWLHARYEHFEGAVDKGLVIIPCELIDYNGEKLKEIVLQYADLWQLEAGFVEWIHSANTFCSTLVDRIVTGHPRDEHQALQEKVGYRDSFMTTAEYFYLFVIQGPEWLAEEMKLDQLPLNIKIVDNIRPYKERKVAILNGAHTAMVPLAYLAGIDTVGETLQDELLSGYVETLISQEIIPALDLPQDELESFAQDVLQRFRNPYIRHELISISLNSMTKCATRLLPQLLRQIEEHGKVPELMSLAFAAQLFFYRGLRGAETIPLNDDRFWLETFASLWKSHAQQEMTTHNLVKEVLAAEAHWGADLSQKPELVEQISRQLDSLMQQGIRPTIAQALGQ